MEAVWVAILGLLFGSFATAVAYRVPRHESFSKGRSRCPNCGTTLTALDNIPVFSYIALRGRCRHCGEAISARYPLIELTTSALFVGAYLKFGISIDGAVWAAFMWILVVLSVIDIEHHILPNRIVYPSFLAGWVLLTVAALVDDDPRKLVGAAAGMLIFGGFLFLVHVLYPPGMGFGDVKLAFVLGTFLGFLSSPGLVLTGMFLSFLIGGIMGVIVMAATGGDRKKQVPFGPYLAMGTIVTVFFGQPLIDLYLSLF